MTLREMRAILDQRGIRLTRSLGQNFMHDGNQLRRMMAAAELGCADRVLEIGPGLGPLTERLLREAGEVWAIEKDHRLCEFLRERWPAEAKLRLIHGDALEYLARGGRDWARWKVVSNLPFSVASPILVELARSSTGPARMVVTLQREVAERIQAGPGGRAYGLLTLLVALRYTVRGSFRIPAGCFFPAPDVDAACVVLERRPEALLEPAETDVFERLVRTGLGQRRKQVLKVWRPLAGEEAWGELFAAAGLAPEVRAEAVSLEQFLVLARGVAARARLVGGEPSGAGSG